MTEVNGRVHRETRRIPAELLAEDGCGCTRYPRSRSRPRSHGSAHVDRALGTAATVGRCAEGDLLSILHHQGERGRVEPIRHGQTHSLQPGTSAWSGFTTP
ncbi:MULTISPECIES: hypothetical protein [unclassified Streptomyces]|uniref:hypothetical protein n=1 Tax=unclassified Streptomyces TaxID=2593676 RepID=UPI00344709CB